MVGLAAVVAEDLAPENIDQETSEGRVGAYYGKNKEYSGGYNMKNYGRGGYGKRQYRSIDDQEASEGTYRAYGGKTGGYKGGKNYGGRGYSY